MSQDWFPEDVVADLPAQPWLRSVRPVSRCSHGLGRGATRRSRNSKEFLRDALTFAGAGLRYHAKPELARWSRIGLLFYLSHKESAE